MTDSRQDLLRSAWLDAKDGSLSAREQAKAWALREIWKDSGKADYGMKTFIAGKLKKEGGGSPSSEAMTCFFDKVDVDDDWFPGKGNYENMGAPPMMSGQQRGGFGSLRYDHEKKRHRANLRQRCRSLSEGRAEPEDQAALQQEDSLCCDARGLL